MVVAVDGLCRLCGEVHELPDARSDDPEEMGCNTFGRESKFLLWARENVQKEKPSGAQIGLGFKPLDG